MFRVIMLNTRRDLLKACSGIWFVLPVAAFTDEEWLHRDPQDWSGEDIQKILNHSGWIREVALVVDPAQAGDRKGSQRALPRPSGFEIIVRWESALPVRLARRTTPAPVKAIDQYILSIGGIPVDFLAASYQPRPADSAAQELIATELAHNCSILLAGETIHAEHAEWQYGNFANTVVVTFPRTTTPIQSSSGEAIVHGRIGMTSFQPIFPLKLMTYRGKVEL
jgi:hypothetical protein